MRKPLSALVALTNLDMCGRLFSLPFLPPPPIYVERPFVKDLLEITKAKKLVLQRNASASTKGVELDADGFELVLKGGKAGSSVNVGAAVISPGKQWICGPFKLWNSLIRY